jgi:hypothetical protein
MSEGARNRTPAASILPENQDGGAQIRFLWLPVTAIWPYDLNRDVYWTMVAHLQRERAAEALQHDLIQADAPFELMQTFFGLSSREYSRLRRVLSAVPAVGRPPEADEASQQTLWAAWTCRRKGTDAELLTPQAYLDLHRETGIGLRAIWNLTRRWAALGDLGGARSGNGVAAKSAGTTGGGSPRLPAG